LFGYVDAINPRYVEAYYARLQRRAALPCETPLLIHALGRAIRSRMHCDWVINFREFPELHGYEVWEAAQVRPVEFRSMYKKMVARGDATMLLSFAT
jgi:hypothetical protein